MLTQSCRARLSPIDRPSVDERLGQRAPPLPKLVHSVLDENPRIADPPVPKDATQAKNNAAVTPTKITRNTTTATSRDKRGRKVKSKPEDCEFVLALRTFLNTRTSRTRTDLQGHRSRAKRPMNSISKGGKRSKGIIKLAHPAFHFSPTAASAARVGFTPFSVIVASKASLRNAEILVVRELVGHESLT
jgi:hypothetical protein